MPDSILSASSNVQPVFEMLILDPSNTKGYTAEEFEQLRQEHFAIRKKVFCDEQGFSAEDEFDELRALRCTLKAEFSSFNQI